MWMHGAGFVESRRSCAGKWSARVATGDDRAQEGINPVGVLGVAPERRKSASAAGRDESDDRREDEEQKERRDQRDDDGDRGA